MARAVALAPADVDGVAAALQAGPTSPGRRPSSASEMGYRCARRHVFRPVQAPAARHRPSPRPTTGSTSLDQVVEQEGETRARFLDLQAPQARAPAPDRPAAADPDPLHQHDQPRAGARLPGRRGDGAAHPPHRPLERGGDGPAREHPLRRASAATSRRTPRSASLYETGFNHFFRGKDGEGGGDQIFYQGHAAPGIYARAFLEGRLTEDQLDHFRRETEPGQGLSSYPHPRLMPDFWEYPTVSMGLGPITRHLPGALQPLPAQPRPARHLASRASGRSSATARPTSPSRSARCSSRRARASTT